MEFTRKKFAVDAVTALDKVSIETIQPYYPMPAPVYVLFKENQKYVSIKAPLDFFIPSELQRYAPFKNFYFPEFIFSLDHFRDAAKKIKIHLNPQEIQGWGKSSFFDMACAPFEISDLILQLLEPLWWTHPKDGTGIELVPITVFVNELCDPISSDDLIRARDQDLIRFEKAILQSSCTVFMALILGYCNLGFLSRLRFRVFERVVGSPEKSELDKFESDELIRLVENLMETSGSGIFLMKSFDVKTGVVAQKIFDRLRKVRRTVLVTGRAHSSIYGEKGFIDV